VANNLTILEPQKPCTTGLPEFTRQTFLNKDVQLDVCQETRAA